MWGGQGLCRIFTKKCFARGRLLEVVRIAFPMFKRFPCLSKISWARRVATIKHDGY
jgi:hypothetical protein